MTQDDSTFSEGHRPVLVCGLGQLGHACLASLRGYGVRIYTLDLLPFDAASLGVSRVTLGDFRNPSTLLAAGLGQCRSVLFVAGDARTNMQGALAARHLSPRIRVVVRGGHEAPYALLQQHLGDFVAYAPHQLAAASIGLAALESEAVAHFYLRERLFHVVEHVVASNDALCGRELASLEHTDTRVVLHVPANGTDAEPRNMTLERWQPDLKLEVGDRLYLLTAREPAQAHQVRSARKPLRTRVRDRLDHAIKWLEARSFVPHGQGSQIVLGAGLATAVLVGLTVHGFASELPAAPVSEALRAALLILFSNGHLADVYDQYSAFSGSMHWLEVLLSVGGTVLTAVLYALLTDRLLSAHFQLLARRPRLPRRGHVVIVGLGGAGRETAAFLALLHRRAVAIDKAAQSPSLLPNLPVVHADATQLDGLLRARVPTAAGVVAVTGDDLVNVEIALLARTLNPGCQLVVRLLDPRLVDSVAELLPQAQVLCIASLAAAAFGAAALGEHVSSMFHLQNAPILVTEYAVEADDGLVGLPLWEVAEGYGVMPLWLEKPATHEPFVLTEAWANRLAPGDRLVVLASAQSLEAIERKQLSERGYVLHIERVLPFAEELPLVSVLSRALGLTLKQARDLLHSLPITLSERVYRIHGLRTKHELEGNGLVVELLAA